MSKTIQPNQNIIDKAIEMAGDAGQAFKLALENEVSVTDDVAPGVELKPVEAVNDQLQQEITRRNITPATNAHESNEFDRIFSEEFDLQFE